MNCIMLGKWSQMAHGGAFQPLCLVFSLSSYGLSPTSFPPPPFFFLLVVPPFSPGNWLYSNLTPSPTATNSTPFHSSLLHNAYRWSDWLMPIALSSSFWNMLKNLSLKMGMSKSIHWTMCHNLCLNIIPNFNPAFFEMNHM